MGKEIVTIRVDSELWNKLRLRRWETKKALGVMIDELLRREFDKNV